MGDVLDAEGYVLSFVAVSHRYNLDRQYRPLWSKIKNLLQPLQPIPRSDRLCDWCFTQSPISIKALPLHILTAKSVHPRLLSIHEHGNDLGHMQKSFSWWRKHIRDIRKSFKSRLYLWRCSLGVLPMGSFLAKCGMPTVLLVFVVRLQMKHLIFIT